MFKRNSRILTIELLIIMFIGLLMIYSASSVWAEYKFKDQFYFVKRQFIFMIVGLVIMQLMTRIDLNKIRGYIKPLFIISIISLILVLIPGIGIEKNGSRSWFGFGSFSVQPSEFFKIIAIIYISDYLAKRNHIRSFIKDLLVPACVCGIGFILILLQPDFGSGIVMCCSLVIIVLVADAPIKYFIRVGMVSIVGLVGLIISAPYRLARITSFINPWADPLGSGFQIIQSLFSIGPGGILGVGLGNSTQKHFYLPEPHTDFIFAIYAEEMGFIGCILLIGLYILIIYEGIKIAKSCESSYMMYIAMGLIALFAIQVMINLGVVVGLFPVTGITLPLCSYGGSSLVVMLGAMGLIESIANQK
ncbi:MAG: putative lipid II flippase FtsW [Erysipelotrichaceae bacterium]